MEDFDEIIAFLKKPCSILFVDLDTDESYRHDQSDSEIVIPPVGSTIQMLNSDNVYKVESITFDYQSVIVRLTKERY